MATKNNLYKVMLSIIEQDVGMIYGPTGSGKSFLVQAVVEAAVDEGIKVAFLDTEKNYMDADMAWFKKHTDYEYIARYDGVMEWVMGMKPGKKLIVIDSLGQPVLGKFAQSNLRERGEMLMGGLGMLYQLKTYCQQQGAMALVTNQPVSEMGARKDMHTGELLEALDPFGGKWGHSVKEVFRTEKRGPGGIETVIDISVFKSRHMPTNLKVAEMRITSAGTTVRFMPYEGRKGRGRVPVTVILAKSETGSKRKTEAPPEPETTEKDKPKKKPATDPPEGPQPEQQQPEEPAEKVDPATEQTVEDEKPEQDEATPAAVDIEKMGELAAINTDIAAIAKEGGITDAELTGFLYGFLKLKSLEEIEEVETAERFREIVQSATTARKKAGESGDLLDE